MNKRFYPFSDIKFYLQGSGPSIQNKGEAEYVTMTVTSLLESGMEASNITVLTFYEAQKQLISDQLEKTVIHFNLSFIFTHEAID